MHQMIAASCGPTESAYVAPSEHLAAFWKEFRS